MGPHQLMNILLHLFIRVCMLVYGYLGVMAHDMEVRGKLVRISFSSSTMWVLGTKHR